jgi:hypothetical protein
VSIIGINKEVQIYFVDQRCWESGMDVFMKVIVLVSEIAIHLHVLVDWIKVRGVRVDQEGAS